MAECRSDSDPQSDAHAQVIALHETLNRFVRSSLVSPVERLDRRPCHTSRKNQPAAVKEKAAMARLSHRTRSWSAAKAFISVSTAIPTRQNGRRVSSLVTARDSTQRICGPPPGSAGGMLTRDSFRGTIGRPPSLPLGL